MKRPRVRIGTLMLLVAIFGLLAALVVLTLENAALRARLSVDAFGETYILEARRHSEMAEKYRAHLVHWRGETDANMVQWHEMMALKYFQAAHSTKRLDLPINLDGPIGGPPAVPADAPASNTGPVD